MMMTVIIMFLFCPPSHTPGPSSSHPPRFWAPPGKATLTDSLACSVCVALTAAARRLRSRPSSCSPLSWVSGISSSPSFLVSFSSFLGSSLSSFGDSLLGGGTLGNFWEVYGGREQGSEPTVQSHSHRTNSDPARGSPAPANPACLAWPSTASCAMTLYPSTASLPGRGEA